MRLFIGLPVPSRVSQALACAARATGLPKARWTPPENMHLTLVFLGEVAEERLPCIFRQLEALESPTLQIKFNAFDMFPRAGVLFASVEPAPVLLYLQYQVVARIHDCGFALDERPYHPHITVARFQGPARLTPHRLVLPAELRRSFDVDRINLYRSHTTPEGPQYEVLK